MATNDQHNDALLTERNTEALSTNKGDKAGVPNQGKQDNHVNQDAKTVFRKTVPAREQMVTDKAVIATDKDDNPRAVPDDAKTVFRKPISQSKAEEIAQSVAKAKASAKKITTATNEANSSDKTVFAPRTPIKPAIEISPSIVDADKTIFSTRVAPQAAKATVSQTEISHLVSEWDFNRILNNGQNFLRRLYQIYKINVIFFQVQPESLPLRELYQ